jgi:NAD(P)-dependent dehydrogenase (short-subunit alcohol dehydrogenase family)
VEGIDLSDSRVIVTGGASGIGIETAHALAAAGAERGTGRWTSWSTTPA